MKLTLIKSKICIRRRVKLTRVQTVENTDAYIPLIKSVCQYHSHRGLKDEENHVFQRDGPTVQVLRKKIQEVGVFGSLLLKTGRVIKLVGGCNKCLCNNLLEFDITNGRRKARCMRSTLPEKYRFQVRRIQLLKNKSEIRQPMCNSNRLLGTV